MCNLARVSPGASELLRLGEGEAWHWSVAWSILIDTPAVLKTEARRRHTGMGFVQGFDNLNALLQLEDSPASAYSAGGLAALVVVKIAATAVCRGSGLVGGVYAPSLFMGVARAPPISSAAMAHVL